MFRINYKSGLPIYEQVYREAVKLAALGAFGASGQLPSVRSVAQELGINPNTVQKAYTLLERDGVICSLPGKGSFLSAEFDAGKSRREEALKKVREAAAEALECGLSKEEITQLVKGLDEKKEGA